MASDDFRVVDKRHDRDSGADGDDVSGKGSEAGTEKGGPVELPSEFSTLVVSLASSGYLSLGEIPDPSGAEPVVNMDLARHSIDLLLVLRDKTRGNLTDEESMLLTKFIQDLQFKFITKLNKS